MARIRGHATRTARTLAFIGAALIALGFLAILLDHQWGIFPMIFGSSLGGSALAASYFRTTRRQRDDEPGPPTTRR